MMRTSLISNKLLMKVVAAFLVAFYVLTFSKLRQLDHYSSHQEDVPLSNSVGVSNSGGTELAGGNVTEEFLLNHKRPHPPVLSLTPFRPKEREKLQVKLDRIHQQTGRPYQGDALWELSDFIPPWMKEYFAWHRQERQKLAEANWIWIESAVDSNNDNQSAVKLMVMQCIKYQDTKCGGTADRLKAFVYLLREAYEMNRLLLIHWTLPARIEEFLVPPVGGIDWRVPQWLEPVLYNVTIGRKLYKDVEIFGEYRNSSVPLFRTRLQSVNGFASYYNAFSAPGEASFEDVYHDVWRIFFRPSLPVAERIENEMAMLEPGEYAAAHVRALYGRITERPDDQAVLLARNAINCASQLRPGGPFFFASDHTFTTRAALDYGSRRRVAVYTRKHESQPLHFDKAPNVTQREPWEFYDTFVDLYLMGMSKCLTYNRGGFGQWALLIGYDPNCFIFQKTSHLGIAVRCNWTKPIAPNKNASTAKKGGTRNIPLFLDSMT